MKLTIDLVPADDDDYQDALREAAEAQLTRAHYAEEDDYENAVAALMESMEESLRRWQTEPWGDIRVEFDLVAGTATVKDQRQ